MNQKPGKVNFRELVSKKIPGGAYPRATLEACSALSAPRLVNRSVFILDPRLGHTDQWRIPLPVIFGPGPPNLSQGLDPALQADCY